jgi:hypothetical protein
MNKNLVPPGHKREALVLYFHDLKRLLEKCLKQCDISREFSERDAKRLIDLAKEIGYTRRLLDADDG